MNIELTELEYKLLNLFMKLNEKEKITVLSTGAGLPSGQPASAFPDRKAV